MSLARQTIHQLLQRSMLISRHPCQRQLLQLDGLAAVALPAACCGASLLQNFQLSQELAALLRHNARANDGWQGRLGGDLKHDIAVCIITAAGVGCCKVSASVAAGDARRRQGSPKRLRLTQAVGK
jgi:hypothetical protein